MTRIGCLTCNAILEASDDVSLYDLAAQNNWLPVEINNIAGYLCEQCSKWIDIPIRIWRDKVPEYFEIERQAATDRI